MPIPTTQNIITSKIVTMLGKVGIIAINRFTKAHNEKTNCIIVALVV
jgi:hypothetical protein